jgi:hypothetical protein
MHPPKCPHTPYKGEDAPKRGMISRHHQQHDKQMNPCTRRLNELLSTGSQNTSSALQHPPEPCRHLERQDCWCSR